MVQEIERLEAELQRVTLANAEVFQGGEIPIVVFRIVFLPAFPKVPNGSSEKAAGLNHRDGVGLARFGEMPVAFRRSAPLPTPVLDWSFPGVG